ncbi:MAG: cadherin-like domain-containing protein, partial [Pirellulaceae bacterium]|nr:cadherin-like domain-containing protein [Pirellulaceae bacterium]
MSKRKRRPRAATRKQCHAQRRRMFLESLEDRRLLAVVTVDSTSDISDGDTSSITALSNSPGEDGAITLREAIIAANNTLGGDEIAFNIPGTGPHTIQPTSQLPDITDTVTIDGYTQSGAAANTNPVGQGLNTQLAIQLDGTNAGAGSGLVLRGGDGGSDGGSDGSTIRGLAINRFPSVGIFIIGGSGHTVEGNFIGTDVTGLSAAGNMADGVAIEDSRDNTVGGTSLAARNLISGNNRGVGIFNSPSTGNIVQGNLVGTDAAGTADLGNTLFGIHVFGASTTTIGGTATGAGNLVSGNDSRGINLSRGSSTSMVQGNFVGTQVDGTGDLGNTLDGIRILDSPDNTITGNVIAGNDQNGVVIEEETAARNIVRGNLIGLDATGDTPLANAGSGVVIISARENTIGGTGANDANTISGNSGQGIRIENGFSQGNQVQGNLIGTNATGAVLGNGSHGILAIGSGANEIGGSDAGAGNTIAYNGGDGVAVVFAQDLSFFKFIRQNSTFQNAGLGIDLEDDGVTPNDDGDVDIGANDLYNFPILETASISGGDLTLTGFARPDALIELFIADPDPTGFGEGRTFLTTLEEGSAADTDTTTGTYGPSPVNGLDQGTDTTNRFSFIIPLAGLPAPVSSGIALTATASDGVNTSEFSGNVVVAGARLELDFGDAPTAELSGLAADYPTLLPDGARHSITGVGPFLGATAPDGETDGQPDLDAMGDDNNGVDDEDLIDGSEFQIFVTPGSEDSYFSFWIDFNRNGSWEDAGDRVVADLLVPGGGQPGQLNVPVTLPPDVTGGKTFARARVSSMQELSSLGPAPDGEVEDFTINIQLPGSVHGFKFEDIDADGMYDPRIDQPMEGVDFQLTGDVDGDGSTETVITTSAANGQFQFLNVFPGDFNLGELVPPGTSATTPTSVDITVQSGQSLVAIPGQANPPGRLFASVPPLVSITDVLIGDIVELDPLTGEELNRFASPEPDDEIGFDGLAFDGNSLWYFSGNSDTLYELDPDSGAVRDADVVGPFGVSLAALGGSVYWDNSNGSIIEFDPTTDTVIGQLDLVAANPGLPTETFALAGASGPDALFVSYALPSEILEIDTQTSLITNRISLPPRGTQFPTGAAVVDGDIFVSYAFSDEDQIEVYNRTGNPLRVLSPAFEISALGGDAVNSVAEVNLGSTLMFGNRLVAATQFDFGDAPEGIVVDGVSRQYPVLLESDGARHTIINGGPFLGSRPGDAETDGQPNSTATGDDADTDGDDEDVVGNTTVTVTAGQPLSQLTLAHDGGNDGALLSLWIDLNQDGDWTVDEQILADRSVTAGPGTTSLDNITLPIDTRPGTTFARARISTQSGLTPSGEAPDGEVEDFTINVLQRVAMTGVSATQDDRLVTDVDGDDNADPGDVIRFTVQIDNTGDTDLTDVQFAQTLDPNTTLVPGSINVSPLAFADDYVGTGELRFEGFNLVAGGGGVTITDPANGLFANDVEFLGDTFALSTFDATSAQGGTVNVNSDGTFTYDPVNDQFVGTDTFTYTIADSAGLSDIGTVTITVDNNTTVLTDNGLPLTFSHVNDSNVPGDGSFENPHGSLSDANDDAQKANRDVVYIAPGTSFVDQFFELAMNQRFLGQGENQEQIVNTDQLGIVTLPTVGSPSGQRPALSAPDGLFTLNAQQNTQISNVTIDNTGPGIRAGIFTG